MGHAELAIGMTLSYQITRKLSRNSHDWNRSGEDMNTFSHSIEWAASTNVKPSLYFIDFPGDCLA